MFTRKTKINASDIYTSFSPTKILASQIKILGKLLNTIKTTT